MPKASPRVHREVVSYVRRSPRMNQSQEKAWERHADDWLVAVPTRETSTSIATDARIDWTEVFDREAPLCIEIGSGMGDALIPAAAERPEANVVAFEVYQAAVASTLAKIAKAGLSNVKVVMANGSEGLELLVAPETVTELWTFFPDPWHKKKHNKRRLINKEFGSLVASRLTADGVWRIATDWADYAEWIQTELSDHPELIGGPVPRWPGRAVTKYERKGLAAGREIADFAYRRRP